MEWKDDYINKKLRIKEDAGIELNGQNLGGEILDVYGLWTKLQGHNYKEDVPGNPAAMLYNWRAEEKNLPDDDMEVYGHVGNFGHIIHISELEEIEDGDK